MTNTTTTTKLIDRDAGLRRGARCTVDGLPGTFRVALVGELVQVKTSFGQDIGFFPHNRVHTF